MGAAGCLDWQLKNKENDLLTAARFESLPTETIKGSSGCCTEQPPFSQRYTIEFLKNHLVGSFNHL